MTEQDIAGLPKNHPDFFTHHPELLQQLSHFRIAMKKGRFR